MATFGSPLEVHAIRLLPGMDLKKSLIDLCALRGLRAAFVMTCVGSLKSARLRRWGGLDIWKLVGFRV